MPLPVSGKMSRCSHKCPAGTTIRGPAEGSPTQLPHETCGCSVAPTALDPEVRKRSLVPACSSVLLCVGRGRGDRPGQASSEWNC